MLRYLLVFLIGALLGANVAWYYARSRDAGEAPPRTEVPVRTPDAASTTPSVSPPAPVTSAAPAVLSSGLVLPVAGVTPALIAFMPVG